MNENIIHFFKNKPVLLFVVLMKRVMPWCFSCFYAFNHEEGLLYFKSSADSIIQH